MEKNTDSLSVTEWKELPKVGSFHLYAHQSPLYRADIGMDLWDVDEEGDGGLRNPPTLSLIFATREADASIVLTQAQFEALFEKMAKARLLFLDELAEATQGWSEEERVASGIDPESFQ